MRPYDRALAHCGSCAADDVPRAVLNVDTEDQQGNTQIGVNLDVYKTPMDWERRVEDAGGAGCDVKGTLHGGKVCYAHGGSRVWRWVTGRAAPQVAGNFRIALGHAKQHKHSGHAHTVYQFNMDDLRNFNSSHIIHHLAFGAPFPGMHNGLDGVEKVVKGGALSASAVAASVMGMPADGVVPPSPRSGPVQVLPQDRADAAPQRRGQCG